MARIDPDEIERVKAAHPIADAVRRHGVQLRRRGRALAGRCPFHDDRTPSLMVWPHEGRFKCFGCGVGGDVIEFVRRSEGCDFRTAVAHLVEWGAGSVERGVGNEEPVCPPRRRAEGRETLHAPRRTSNGPVRVRHIAVPPPPPALDDEAVSILDAAADAYHHLLLDTPWIQQLLASRGVSLGTARAYRIGYSDGRRLVPALNRRGLPPQRARELGLLTGRGEWFAHRLTFPVSEAGRTAFMMGRRTREEDEPKYLGLPRPKPLYLGGNPEARETLVVEGPFDLWLLHEWGYGAQYALVALLEALPTAAHLDVLRGYARLFVCLDNDEAGRLGTAVLRDALGQRVRIVPLPPGVHDVGDLGGRPADDAVRQFHTILADLVR